GMGWATGTSRLLPSRGRVPRHRLISTVTGSWPSGARSALATGVVSAQLGTQSSWAGHITSIMCCSPARATDGAIRVTGASAASSASTRWMEGGLVGLHPADDPDGPVRGEPEPGRLVVAASCELAEQQIGGGGPALAQLGHVLGARGDLLLD